eukprot:TRINITY_DN9622_c0_g1_i3.p2 TRINITY_DN9622_c0_g1~~TRINITY_DN9622_c0_g1_i3.p2  ORF type:complete len:179 (+),score=31.32 TRINITY_DN9622_c0_g1_i3:992-1528(+)
MPVYALYLIFFFSLALGAAAAFLIIAKFPHLAKFFIGATGGVLLAVLVNPLGPAYALYYLFFPIAGVFAAVGAVFGKMRFRVVYVLTASFLAAYLVVRGSSVFSKNYPSSIEFYREHKEGEIKAFPYGIIVYTVIIVVAGAVIAPITIIKRRLSYTEEMDEFFSGKSNTFAEVESNLI